MAKVCPVSIEQHYSSDGWVIKCPGCGNQHFIPNNGVWTFNGDVEKPTFKPSINESCNAPGPKHNPRIPYSRCHYVITDGMIHFCEDCTHDKKNQTLELLDVVLMG